MQVTSIFSVRDPIKVRRAHQRAMQIISEEKIREFWEDHSELGEGRGCYIFALRAGKGITPWYVGKTERSFKSEVFASHKLKYFHEAMSLYSKGTPVLFFLVAPESKSKRLGKHIRDLEEFLIQTARVVNPNLLNKQHNRDRSWTIDRVLEPGRGNIPQDVFDFQRMLPPLAKR